MTTEAEEHPLDTIEEHIRRVFDSIKADIPTVGSMSFHIGSTRGGPVWGFLHTGRDTCETFDSIGELRALVIAEKARGRTKEILFRQF